MPPSTEVRAVVHVVGPWEQVAGFYVQRCLRCDALLAEAATKPVLGTGSGYKVGQLIALATENGKPYRYIVQRKRNLTPQEEHCA